MFGYKPRFDERSGGFGIVSALKGGHFSIQKTEWETGTVLNQLRSSACVGFAWLGALLAEPKSPSPQPSAKSGNELATQFYENIKKVDMWNGEDYDGTSILSGAWYLRDNGMIEKYYWCFSVADVKKAVCNIGPVVAGIRWHRSMYNARNGLIKVNAKHDYNMHAILVTGYDPAVEFEDGVFEAFKIRNSWGRQFGRHGDAYIKVDDFEKVMLGGEACVPMGQNPPQFDGAGRLDKQWKTKYSPNYIRMLLVSIISFFLRR